MTMENELNGADEQEGGSISSNILFDGKGFLWGKKEGFGVTVVGGGLKRKHSFS